jgi:hypothetical protein
MPFPLILELNLALLTALAAFVVAFWASATTAAREAGEELSSQSRARSFLQRRRDRSLTITD